jgi:hypothetical protein
VRAWASAASLRERRDEVELAGRVLRGLGPARHVITSANGTWVDRAEAAALRGAAPVVVSSMYGHMAETFSVGPLAGIAAVLLTGRLPALFGPGPGGRGNVVASTAAVAPSFTVLCTDHVGLVSGCRIERGGREVAA